MTFDSIWDEVEKCGPAVYIVSWNDHFFVLRIEEHSCYIIDSLGERLYEECKQAYILHFDDTTTLNVPKPSKAPAAAGAGGSETGAVTSKGQKGDKGERGKKGEKMEKNEKAERVSEKRDRVKKSEKNEKAEKRDKGEKSKKNGKAEKNEKRDRVENSSDEQKSDDKMAEIEGGSCSSAIEARQINATNGWKDTCRQFVKGFLAAIQLREAELEAKKITSGKNSQQQSIYQKLQRDSCDKGNLGISLFYS